MKYLVSVLLTVSERKGASSELVKDHSERPEIAGEGIALSPMHLRCLVVRGANDRKCFIETIHFLGVTKTKQLRVPFA